MTTTNTATTRTPAPAPAPASLAALTALTARVAGDMALADIFAAPDAAAFVARVVAATDGDSCLDCEWTIASIVEQFGVEREVARAARARYADELRAAAAFWADADEA